MSYNKRENKKKINYTLDDEVLFLRFLLSSSEAYIRCSNILNPEYWDRTLKNTCQYIIDYTTKNNILPTPEQVLSKTKQSIDVIKDIKPQHIDDFLTEIEQFCRHKALELVIYAGPDLLKDGDYGGIERRCKDAMLISLTRNLGTDYFEDPETRLLKMRDKTDMTATGWKELDDVLFGGLNRGELTLFVAGSNVGKSIFLQNITVNWMNMGLNIVYITLEMSEALIALRMDAMNTGLDTRSIIKDPAAAASIINSQKNTSNKDKGNIFIKYMATGGTTVNDIKAYIKEFEIQNGYRPDAIVIDYLDLLYPSVKSIDISDQFIKDKVVSEEIRGFSQEFGMLCVSASQLNREGSQQTEFNHSHIAGGISKINTADNLIGIYATATMKERGEYQLQMMKTRSSSGIGKKIDLSYNPESMRVTDFNQSAQYSNNQNADKLVKELNHIKANSSYSSGNPTNTTRETLLDLSSKFSS